MSAESETDNLAHLVGVVEDIKFPFNTRFMFPSKVGGKPAWLVPEDIPDIKCDVCANNMIFLLQIYAPEAETAAAFHRSLLVFTCIKCRCFLKCFRSQLPLLNPFYGGEPLQPNQVPRMDETLDQVCCDSCGLKSHGDSMCRPLPEYGLEIEEVDEIEADLDEEMGDSSDESDDEDVGDIPDSMVAACSEMNIDESEMDLFKEFTETQIEKDSSFRMFKRFVGEAPAQHVIYYALGGTPLWITDQNQMPGDPPKCENCGANRQFEFQIQPQLIYHLMKRLGGYPMDAAPFEWGVVAVFTCTKNCTSGSNPYLYEFTYNQLEPSEWLEFGKERNPQSKAPVVKEPASDEDEWI